MDTPISVLRDDKHATEHAEPRGLVLPCFRFVVPCSISVCSICVSLYLVFIVLYVVACHFIVLASSISSLYSCARFRFSVPYSLVYLSLQVVWHSQCPRLLFIRERGKRSVRVYLTLNRHHPPLTYIICRLGGRRVCTETRETIHHKYT